MATEVIAKQKLKDLIERFSHENAPFSLGDKEMPSSWELDEREGAGRMRKRLRRTKTSLHPKFYKQACSDHLIFNFSNSVPAPQMDAFNW